jgi:hypothetical protein
LTTQTGSDDDFVARLTEDLSRILGTGIVVDDMAFAEDGDRARIRVLCLFDGRAETLETDGATNLEAYNRMVKAAAELRLALAARNMIAPM